MAAILTSSTEPIEQITTALEQAGHTVEKTVHGQVQITTPAKTGKEPAAKETFVAPADKTAEETQTTTDKVVEEKATEETVSDSEPGKEEKKTEESKEGKENKSAKAEETEETEDKSRTEDKAANRADRKLLKRVDTLTAQRNQWKEEAEQRDAEIRELKTKLEGRAKTEATEEPEVVKPTRPRMPVNSDPDIAYDDEKMAAAREKYEKELDSYEEKREAYFKVETTKEFTARQQKDRLEQETRELIDAHAKRMVEVRQEHDDVDEVIAALEDADIPFKEIVTQGILESEVSGKLSYYLGTHLEEAEQLSNMPTARALRELGKLEAKLADGGRLGKKPSENADNKTPKQETKPTSSETKPVTKQQKPITTLNPTSVPVVARATDIAENKGSVLEYKKLRDAERIANGKAPW